MELITSSERLSEYLAEQRLRRRSIALVPTMGALHPGHLSLIDLAREHADTVVVSVFVNPLQFEHADDFDLYPQTLSIDEQKCRERGVSALYAPTAAQMYPDGFRTSVHVSHFSEILEGASRPGHFDGVATVVAKFFISVDPDVAVFGAKDFQQVAVVRRMIRDLDFRLRLIVAPTVREHDGLAMSSRNSRLTQRGRRAAAQLSLGLRSAQQAFVGGTVDPTTLIDVVRRCCNDPLLTIDYVTLVDPNSLEPVSQAHPDSVLLIAAIVDEVRLIDNAALGSPM